MRCIARAGLWFDAAATRKGKASGREARIAEKRKVTGEEATKWYDDRCGHLEASSTWS
jgi:hypothetical protein